MSKKYYKYEQTALTNKVSMVSEKKTVRVKAIAIMTFSESWKILIPAIRYELKNVNTLKVI